MRKIPLRELLIEEMKTISKVVHPLAVTKSRYNQYSTHSEEDYIREFGNFAEYKRQSGLTPQRGENLLRLQTARHNFFEAIKEFQENELDGLIGKYERPISGNRYKRMVVASDFHAADLDPFVMDVFLDTLKRTKPDVVCLAGDVFDLYDFSRFTKDPRKTNVKAEFDFVRMQIFDPIRNAVGSDCQIDFILGNHELRVLNTLASASPSILCLMDVCEITLADLFGVHEHEINLISRFDIRAHNGKLIDQEVSKNYKTYFDSVTVAHQMPRNARQFKLNMITGHRHRPGYACDKSEHFGDMWHMELGSMCKKDLHYVEDIITAQQGFGIVHFDTEKKCAVAEPVFFNNRMAVVGGKIFIE